MPTVQDRRFGMKFKPKTCFQCKISPISNRIYSMYKVSRCKHKQTIARILSDDLAADNSLLINNIFVLQCCHLVWPFPSSTYNLHFHVPKIRRSLVYFVQEHEIGYDSIRTVR